MARVIARAVLSVLKQTLEAAVERRPTGRRQGLVRKTAKPIIAEWRRMIRDLWRLSARKKRQKMIDDQTADAFEHFLARRKRRHRHAG